MGRSVPWLLEGRSPSLRSHFPLRLHWTLGHVASCHIHWPWVTARAGPGNKSETFFLCTPFTPALAGGEITESKLRARICTPARINLVSFELPKRFVIVLSRDTPLCPLNFGFLLLILPNIYISIFKCLLPPETPHPSLP